MINLVLDGFLVGAKRIPSQGFNRENFFFNSFQPLGEIVHIINISPNGFFLITIVVIVMVGSQILADYYIHGDHSRIWS